MLERQGTETAQDKQRKAYAAFIDLAKKHGQASPEGGFTVKKYIDREKGDCDLVSGRFFGDQAPTIEVFFRKGDEAQQLTLSRGILGQISILQVLYFHRQEGERGKVLVQQDGNGQMPNIDALNGILAEVVKKSATAKDNRIDALGVLRDIAGIRRANAHEAKKKKGKTTDRLSKP